MLQLITAFKFFDADQNLETGMSIEGIGADFLLENDMLNEYTGSGSDWTGIH